jgi:hypothetical protein
VALDGVDDLAGYFFGVPAVATCVEGGESGCLRAALVCGHGGDHLGSGSQGSHLLLGELQFLAMRPFFDAGIDDHVGEGTDLGGKHL